MGQETNIRRVTLFALRVTLLAPVTLVLWWLCLPAYASIVGHIAAFILQIAFSFDISRVVVEPKGFLNTQTLLGFAVGDRTPTTPVAMIVSNTATYFALVLATRRLTWRNTAKVLAIGVAILTTTHIAHIVFFFAFSRTIGQYPQIPTAIAQIFLTLPFLLWIALAYWPSVQQEQTTDTSHSCSADDPTKRL